jgi:P27 family predicted phage terminase small subunit
MARRPKPTKLKIAEGVRKDRINFNEPDAIPYSSEPPEHLDEIGVSAWHDLKEILSTMKVLSNQDRYLLELYSQIYSDYRKHVIYAKNFWVMKVREQKEGIYNFEKCPVNSDLHRFRDQMIKILIECGLTPAARQSVNIEPIPTEDDMMRDDHQISQELEQWTPTKE